MNPLSAMQTTDDDKGKRPPHAGRGNVIHVAFGSGGGRLGETLATGGAAAPSIPPPPDGREPVTDLFSRREVAKLLGVTETAPSLARTARKIVSPSGQKGKLRAYTFQDLIAYARRASCSSTASA